MGMEFLHIGVPTKEVQSKETYVEALKVHITNPDDHEYKFEYLRFEPCSPLPAIMQVNPHVAIKVDNMKEALIQGNRVEIRGLGSFKIKNYEGYSGRNPKTGKMVNVAPKKLPFFRAGKELKEFLNE